jgi:spermidine synthase
VIPNFVKTKILLESAHFLFGAGFVSILAQVVILRELNAAFYGIELIYILALGIWLLGTAIGALIGRRSSIPQESSIRALFIIFAIILIFDILFIRGINKIFNAVPGAFLPFTTQLIGLFLVLMPVSILTGLLFQWAAKNIIEKNETLAKAYSLESAGGIMGGLASTLLLSAGLQNYTIALICSAISLGISFYGSWKIPTPVKKYISLVVILMLFVLFNINKVVDHWSLSWNYNGLIDSRDTPYNRTTITSSGKQICVFENGALSYETESESPEEFVQLSTLQTEKLDRILVLGGGFQGIIYELLKLPVKSIDYIEISEKMIDLMLKYLPREIHESMLDKKVNIIYDDPRKFLQSKNLYDLILINMPEPTSAQTNRFYTKEFYNQCSERLSRNGIITFKIQSAENLWTSSLQKRNGSIYYALKSSFNNIIVLPGTANIFVASNGTLSSDTKDLITRFNSRKLSTKLVTPQYINYILTNDRFTWIHNILSSQSVPANSDLQPACYGYTISIWLSKFFPELTDSGYSLHAIVELNKPFIIISTITILIGLIIAGRKYYQLNRLVLVFGGGFIGMITETLLLILYQTKNGILYRDIGILLMMFMFGLSLGSIIVNRLFASQKIKNSKIIGTILIFAFALINLGIYSLAKTDFLNGLLAISIALLFDGIIVSGIFAFASLFKVKNQLEQVKQLYSIDLIGGSLGSIAASIIMIPVLGLLSTLIIITLISLIMLLFLV